MSQKILRQNNNSEHKVIGFHRVTSQKLLYAREKKMKSFCQFMTNSILVAKKKVSVRVKSGPAGDLQIKWGQTHLEGIICTPY